VSPSYGIRLKQSIKAATGRSLWLRYSFLALWRLTWALAALVTNRVGSGKHGGSPESRQAYAERAVGLYKSWLGIERFYGKVAEVGPGEVSETALLIAAEAGSDVHVVDRFSYGVNGASNPNVVIHRHNLPAEKFFLQNRDFDFIVSCAVMEHLYDPLTALRAMAAALKPGGAMVHIVDCSDHGRFSDSMHDLSFLRISPALYYPIKVNSGLNRIRLSAYVDVITEIGAEYKVLITHLTGVSEDIEPVAPFSEIPPELVERCRANVAAIRNRLAQPFRSMSDLDLMVKGFVLIARAKAAEPKPSRLVLHSFQT
jgi:SAM-dependent methyltransferase